MYETLLFKRGYLITNTSIENSSDDSVRSIMAKWDKRAIDSFYIYCDPALNAHVYDKQHICILLLGLILDPLNNLDNPENILSTLHDKYLRSEDDFFDYVDTLTGRFVILLVSPNNKFIFQDAAGNMSLFYHDSSDGMIISSHIQLIAEVNNLEMPQQRKDFINSEDYQQHSVKYFPGLLTPYPNVVALTPNTLLYIDELRIRRFFPRDNITKQAISHDLIDELAHLFLKQIEMLRKKRQLSVSLTAGIDSRLTLAATRPFKDSIFYYTFVIAGDSVQERDAYFAKKVCDGLNIEHHILRVKPAPVTQDDCDFLKVFRRNTAYMRADRQGMIAKTLYEQHPKDCLHIKSNVSEISRAFYRKQAYLLPNTIHPSMLSLLYGIKSQSSFCINAFQDFIDTTNFKKRLIFNYDVCDLFYWEHRIGCWQSLQILDFDMSQDTLILYNNRYILNKMLSVTLRERRNNMLYDEIIKSLWPEALTIPYNPWRQNNVMEKARKLAVGMCRRFLLNG